MIYFIQAGENGPIKIGKSDDPERRLKDLQTGHYEELRLLWTWDHEDDDEWSEKKIHNHLCEFKINGEWFKPHQKVIEFIENQMHEYGSIFVENGPCIESQIYYKNEMSSVFYTKDDRHIYIDYKNGSLKIHESPWFEVDIHFDDRVITLSRWDEETKAKNIIGKIDI